MAVMGMYCKAYPIARLREYNGWSEYPGSMAVDALAAGGTDGASAESEPQYLFVRENLVVTNGVFMDENIVFDTVTPEWEAFCRDVLQFEVPPYEVKAPAPGAAAEATA
jgi:hypothetical protein